MMPSDSLHEQFSRWQRISLMIGIAGVLLAITGFLLDREQAARSYVFGFFFWFGMGAGCMAILLMHHTVGGKWGMIIRRMNEAGARTLPYMAVLLIPILVCIPILYPWVKPEAIHDPGVHLKAGYLNLPFFFARLVFYFLVWAFYAFRLSKLSAEQDETGDERLISRMRAISAPGLVVFTFMTSFAYFDWIMSLEPDWFSTIYGAMLIIGQVLQAFALMIALVIILSNREPLKQYVTPQHLHDLGNMMFAFMILWAYTSFSQFLIIWSGNLPDEIPWYLRRFRGGWGWVALIIVFIHFFTPFVLLLLRWTKRNANRLLKVCYLLFVARIVDTYWVVKPAFYNQKFVMTWTDFVMLIAVGGLWLAMFFRELKSRPLVPERDWRLAEAPRETVAF